MSSVVLGCYPAKTLAEVEKLSLCKIKLNNGYHVEWQNSHEFDLICEDEDIHQTLDIHEDKVTAVIPLQHKDNRDYFITIGLDHTVQVFRFYGEQVASLDEHDDVIIGVIELSDGQIITASKDDTLRFWDVKTGACYSTVEAKIDTLESVQFSAHQKQLAINEPDGVSICRFSGEQVVKLTGQKKPLKSLFQLNCDKWITWSEGENPTLWSDSGQILKRFNFDFSYENGFIQKVAEQQLLIKNANEQVSLWQTDGTLIDSHVESAEVTDLFNTLSKAIDQVEDHIAKYPSINHYKHLRNFIGNRNSRSFLIPSKELEEQKLEFENDAKQKEIWDFFHRPIPRELTTAMMREVKASRNAEKLLQQKVEEADAARQVHQKKRNFNKVVSLIMLLLTLVVGGVGAMLSTGADAPALFNQLMGQYIPELRPLGLDRVIMVCAGATSVPLLFCLIFLIKNRSQKSLQLQQAGNLTLLNSLLPEYCKLINRVKAHRAQLWKSVPLRKNRNLYSGESVNAIIQEVIDTKLEEEALHECSLTKKDIIYSNNEAIVLSDWAVIQSSERRDPWLKKLHPENEFSFWGDKNGSLVFAVQYIQFIFLAADKVALFTGFYDFINQKLIGKSSKSFFYKDVISVTKDDVERPQWFGKDTLSATNINLQVSSGDKLELTILTQESLNSIVEAANGQENKERVSNQSILKTLEARKKSILEDACMDEEEREEELDDIETQIKSMGEANIALDSKISTTKAFETIVNINQQLKLHKQGSHEETVS
ncbi:hypothetical protein L2737_08770 [Shewanella electrodiphila]|uniref:Uncharacterized protein n=1 Tax=Shewanella electrodiphila TaxID=934143 RepID=A0ABT0KNI4_9GAMM|nr:hypothetical protein [Shewanella electrodiphila]MCL1045417.1 hypothetical protein [Shewanella electrodiphila]